MIPQALIYTTKLDAEMKRAVKSNTTFADFMEFEKIKPMMDEIDAMVEQKSSKSRKGTKDHTLVIVFVKKK